MIRQLHTPDGIFDTELTVEQRQVFADMGDLEALIEITIEEMSAHSSPFEHFQFIYKLFGITYPPTD